VFEKYREPLKAIHLNGQFYTVCQWQQSLL